MSRIQVFDRAMCCPTGVCGPQVDPALPRFAADLEWLRSQGHQVDRFNLAQDPARFVTNPVVQKILADEGVECLPLIIVDDRVVSRCEYPNRNHLSQWTGAATKTASLPVTDSGGCCGGSSGCC